ncbi:MAG: flagellar protein FlaG [Gammaproteobacteria bacterium]|nr:flagellar protein FlaG [Gammaproteobacteria bacterium]
MASESIASLPSLVSTSSNRSGEIAVTRVHEVEPTNAKDRQVSAVDHLAKMSDAKAAAAEQTKVSRDAFEKVVSELQTYVQHSRRNLDFHVDDQTGEVVVKVIDVTNDEVIRQIPSEEMLALAKRIKEFMNDQDVQTKGMLLEIKA